MRETLGSHGTVRFDTVSGQPGAMLGVGTVSVEGDEATATPIFCLPGDPVAAQVCFEVFVRPALRKMQGWKTLNRSSVKARATFALQSPAGIREFLRVRIQGIPFVRIRSARPWRSEGSVDFCARVLERACGSPGRSHKCFRGNTSDVHAPGLSRGGVFPFAAIGVGPTSP